MGAFSDTLIFGLPAKLGLEIMAANSKPQIDVAIPSFGYNNHVAINQRFGFIRKAVVSLGARHDGSQLREVVTTKTRRLMCGLTPRTGPKPIKPDFQQWSGPRDHYHPKPRISLGRQTSV
jgi:hypothetical protein